VHVRGTNFQLQVWRALLELAPAESSSYGELARRIRHPAAARAVGSAVGQIRSRGSYRVIAYCGPGAYWASITGDRSATRTMLAWEQLQAARSASEASAA